MARRLEWVTAEPEGARRCMINERLWTTREALSHNTATLVVHFAVLHAVRREPVHHPEPQIVVLADDGHFVARLDMGFRAVRKALEFDGHDAHHTLEQQRHDMVRHGHVEGLGWQILVVTSAQVLGKGLAFELAVAQLLGQEPRLSRHHPRYGGWDRILLPGAA